MRSEPHTIVVNVLIATRSGGERYASVAWNDRTSTVLNQLESAYGPRGLTYFATFRDFERIRAHEII